MKFQFRLIKPFLYFFHTRFLKRQTGLLCILVAFKLLTGCTTLYPIQLYYYGSGSSSTSIEKYAVSAADSNLSIYANIWESKGTTVYLANISNKAIYVDLSESNAIIDGESVSYFNNVTYSSVTTSSNSNRTYTPAQPILWGNDGKPNLYSLPYSIGSQVSSQQGYLVHPEPIIMLPGKSVKKVDGIIFSNVPRTIEIEFSYSFKKGGDLSRVRLKLNLERQEEIPFNSFIIFKGKSYYRTTEEYVYEYDFPYKNPARYYYSPTPLRIK